MTQVDDFEDRVRDGLQAAASEVSPSGGLDTRVRRARHRQVRRRRMGQGAAAAAVVAAVVAGVVVLPGGSGPGSDGVAAAAERTAAEAFRFETVIEGMGEEVRAEGSVAAGAESAELVTTMPLPGLGQDEGGQVEVILDSGRLYVSLDGVLEPSVRPDGASWLALDLEGGGYTDRILRSLVEPLREVDPSRRTRAPRQGHRRGCGRRRRGGPGGAHHPLPLPGPARREPRGGRTGLGRRRRTTPPARADRGGRHGHTRAVRLRCRRRGRPAAGERRHLRWIASCRRASRASWVRDRLGDRCRCCAGASAYRPGGGGRGAHDAPGQAVGEHRGPGRRQRGGGAGGHGAARGQRGGQDHAALARARPPPAGRRGHRGARPRSLPGRAGPAGPPGLRPRARGAAAGHARPRPRPPPGRGARSSPSRGGRPAPATPSGTSAWARSASARSAPCPPGSASG